MERFFSEDARLNRPVTHGVSLLKEVIPRELGRTKKHHSLFRPAYVESWFPSVSLLWCLEAPGRAFPSCRMRPTLSASTVEGVKDASAA